MNGATLPETKGRVNAGHGSCAGYSRHLAFSSQVKSSKHCAQRGRISILFRDSPVPDTWARRKHLPGTLMRTILVFSDVIFQLNVLILRTEMPVFL